MQCVSEQSILAGFTSFWVRFMHNSCIFLSAGLSGLGTLGSVPVQGCQCPPTKTMSSGPSGMWRWSPPG